MNKLFYNLSLSDSNTLSFIRDDIHSNLDKNIKTFKWEKGLCPVAEEVQPKMMQFKTNYRNMDDAREQALILKKLVKSLNAKTRVA